MHKKKCFKCGEEKLIKEFYSHPQMKDKHLNKCKSCCKEYEKLERIVHFEKKRIYERARKRIRIDYIRYNNWDFAGVQFCDNLDIAVGLIMLRHITEVRITW